MVCPYFSLLRAKVGHIIDATRLSDGRYVTLKRIKKSVHPYEIDIGLYFSSGSLASHPENHCIPFYDILSLDDNETVIIVMPLLRSYADPPFDTFGEVVECFRQLFEVRPTKTVIQPTRPNFH